MAGIELAWRGNSGFSFSLRYVLIKCAGPMFMANEGYLMPVVAVLNGGIFLGENIGREKIFAMELVITSVVLFQRFAPLSRRGQP